MGLRRYELTDFEWKAIEPHLPNKPRGVPRVDDRRVLNGIFWVLRSGSPWSETPERYGPRTTVYNRFNRWRKAGVWCPHLPRAQVRAVCRAAEFWRRPPACVAGFLLAARTICAQAMASERAS
jgi:transposase